MLRVVAPHTHVEVGVLLPKVKRQGVMPPRILGEKNKTTNKKTVWTPNAVVNPFTTDCPKKG